MSGPFRKAGDPGGDRRSGSAPEKESALTEIDGAKLLSNNTQIKLQIVTMNSVTCAHVFHQKWIITPCRDSDRSRSNWLPLPAIRNNESYVEGNIVIHGSVNAVSYREGLAAWTGELFL